MSESIPIILVDDHRLFRHGLRQLLEVDPRFEVAGEAASGEEFLDLFDGGAILDGERGGRDPGFDGEAGLDGDDQHENNPPRPLVFMDIDMPGIGGVEATRRAIERDPDLRVVALSMHGEQEFYGPMIEAGAKGFLLKNSDFTQVVSAAETLAAGGTFFSPELMPALVGAARHRDEIPEAEPLSEREAEVLPLVCEGLSNHEIADRLFISKRTVDKHRANILAKTGCRNTASLVIHAVKHNLIKI
jgi:DNA-binding NarL/FixJ family response regulator